jgi:hypothetical protein
MQAHNYLLWLVDKIRVASVRDDPYYVYERALIRYGEAAIPALMEMAQEADQIGAQRACEIIAKIKANKPSN